MTLPEISIRRPVFAWMLMAALLIFGWICFQKMGVSQLPDVDYPVVSVGLNLDGAAPEVMEVDVVDPVEDALTAVQGMQSMSSSAKTGSASITLEFDLDKNIDVAVQEVQTILGQVIRRLPKELDPPTVRKTNPEDHPILWLAATSETLNNLQLTTVVRDQIKDRFSAINGVGEIMLGGYVDPALRVWLSSEKLNRYELTVADILTTIEQEHAEKPSGRIEAPVKEFNIRTLGEAPTVEEFGRLTISRRGGSPNYVPLVLHDVAKIEDGFADVRRKSRSNGKFAIGLGVKKQRGANAVEVARLVKEKVKEIQPFLPKGVALEVRSDSTRFIEDSIHELNFTLLLSGLLTAIVCWLFLGTWAATFNVVLAIPTSVVGSFIALYALGFTLNTFTLLGLSLAIGIVVDDAIMVLENITRHREMGKNRLNAALDGSREITFAAMAATVAIIAIFLPVAFMKGIIGKFFFQFGVTLSVAVALSLLEALTLTPMRCSQFFDETGRDTRLGKAVENIFHSCALFYEKVLTSALNRRTLTLIFALVFFAGTLATIKFLKKEFVPAQDQNQLFLRMQTPVGTSFEIMEKKFGEVEMALKKFPDITHYFGTIGGGSDVNSSSLFLTLKPLKDRQINPETGKPTTLPELTSSLRAEFKNIQTLRTVIQDPSQSAFTSKRGFPVEFTLQGPEWEKLTELTTKMIAAMEETRLMTDIDSNYESGFPEIRVMPDRQKARERGVSVADIADTVNALMGGMVAGKFSKNGHRYDIRVRLSPEERLTAADIGKLRVRNNQGQLIPLSSVVTLKESASLQSIARQDRQRAITLYANVTSGASQAEAIKSVKAIGAKILPDGYYIVMSGSAKTFEESFQSLMFALLLGVIIAYMVLASQFNSFIHPITVLMSLPFSVSGAFLALWIGGQSLNIYSMIGLVLLMGIVKKNSILLVDFTNQLRATGMGVRAALLKACPMRLRAILMTSLATVVGAIPAALAFGPGAETRVPMAIAVIGGVLISTLLTLVVVPCVYSVFSGRDVISPAK